MKDLCGLSDLLLKLLTEHRRQNADVDQLTQLAPNSHFENLVKNERM
jgi:hypothetical protein